MVGAGQIDAELPVPRAACCSAVKGNAVVLAGAHVARGVVATHRAPQSEATAARRVRVQTTIGGQAPLPPHY